MNDDTKIYELTQILRSVERLNRQCEDNMKRLNTMMLELRGVIAMVRPSAKKNEWYGEEVEADPINKSGKDYLDSKIQQYGQLVELSDKDK